MRTRTSSAPSAHAAIDVVSSENCQRDGAEVPSVSGSNGGAVVSANGTSSTTIRVTRSAITGNGAGGGWFVSGTGVVTSYNDNNIDGNGGGNAGNATPPQIVYK